MLGETQTENINLVHKKYTWGGAKLKTLRWGGGQYTKIVKNVSQPRGKNNANYRICTKLYATGTIPTLTLPY